MQIIDFLLDILFSKYSEGKLKKKEMRFAMAKESQKIG